MTDYDRLKELTAKLANRSARKLKLERELEEVNVEVKELKGEIWRDVCTDETIKSAFSLSYPEGVIVVDGSVQFYPTLPPAPPPQPVELIVATGWDKERVGTVAMELLFKYPVTLEEAEAVAKEQDYWGYPPELYDGSFATFEVRETPDRAKRWIYCRTVKPVENKES